MSNDVTVDELAQKANRLKEDIELAVLQLTKKFEEETGVKPLAQVSQHSGHVRSLGGQEPVLTEVRLSGRLGAVEFGL